MFDIEKSSEDNSDTFMTIICLLVVLASAILLAVSYQQKKETIKIDAYISVIEETRNAENKNYKVAYVNYTFAGEEYKNILLPYYKRSMREGKKVKIRINSNSPRKIYATNYLDLFGLFFGGMGILGVLVNSKVE